MSGKLTIQINHHKKILKLRRLDRLIQSKEFVIAWNTVDNIGKRWALRHIEDIAVNNLQNWINTFVFKNFEKCSIRQLRLLASKNHVPYYSRLTRKELISKLIEKGITNDDVIKVANEDETDTSCSRRKI